MFTTTEVVKKSFNYKDSCGFTPTVCRNQGCGATLNKRDLIHHESELCEYRKLKCHSFGEMTKTLADMVKRMARVEINLACVQKIEKNTANIEEKLETVNNEVKGLKSALAEAFDQMKDVLVKMDDKIENARKVKNAPSGDRENIIVAGGPGHDSVEMFNWRQRTWSLLQSMPKKRHAATSFVYNNEVVIPGGYCGGAGFVDGMIKMNVYPHPDLLTHWSECPVKLPCQLGCHTSVLYDDELMITGGYGFLKIWGFLPIQSQQCRTV